MTIKVKHFMAAPQLTALRSGLQGEEGKYFSKLILDLKKTIEGMPIPYQTEQENQEDPKAYLHYFYGGMDWYIIERDSSEEQLQCYGYADLGQGLGGELGYISIAEIISLNVVELDLHWTPTPISEIQQQHKRQS